MTDCVHILVVSEHSSRSYDVARMLCRLGFQISQARTVTEALHAAEDHPDVVLLEVDLPETDVQEICGALKTSNDTSEIPVVLYSATSHASTAAQVEQLGATSFLFFPMDEEQLSVVIRGALARQRCKGAHHHSYGHQSTANVCDVQGV
jgi:DNA-binding NtrC family response regulator